GKLRPESVEPGEIVHADGRVLGTHQGIVNFTVGQRKGLGIAVGEPVFVIRIETASRRVVVGPRELLKTVCVRLREVNWIGGGTLSLAAAEERAIFVKLRSTQEPRPARLLADADSIFVELAEPDHGIAAGQACVFYADGSGTARVLGGGFISKA